MALPTNDVTGFRISEDFFSASASHHKDGVTLKRIRDAIPNRRGLPRERQADLLLRILSESSLQLQHRKVEWHSFTVDKCLTEQGLQALGEMVDAGVFQELPALTITLTECAVVGKKVGAWLKSGKLRALTNLRLISNDIDAQGAEAIAEALKSGSAPRLYHLDLSSNNIGDAGVVAVSEALTSGAMAASLYLCFKTNNISEEGFLHFAGALESASHLPSDLTLSMFDSPSELSGPVQVALVSAYRNNTLVTCSVNDLHDFVRPTHVRGVQLSTFLRNADTFTETLGRLGRHNREWAKTVKALEGEREPATYAKAFICGKAGVGKTTLRLTLEKSKTNILKAKGVRSELKSLAKGTQNGQAPRPTRGIEVSHVTIGHLHSRKSQRELAIWDMAGQPEYEVLHSAFLPDIGLADGGGTFFIVVCRENMSGPGSHFQDLRYWLRFIATNSSATGQEVGGQRSVRKVFVVINCFQHERVNGDPVGRWGMHLKAQKDKFEGFLDLCPKPFVLNAKSRKEVKRFCSELTGEIERMLQRAEPVPKVCNTVLQKCKDLVLDHANYPVVRWEQYSRALTLGSNELLDPELKAATNYLHEAGHLIWFKESKPESEGPGESSYRNTLPYKNVVVLSPEYFCQKVVGHLLLPRHMLEEDERSLAMEYVDSDDPSVPLAMIAKDVFRLPAERTDEMVGMFLRLGLGYAHESDQDKVYIPAIMKNRDEPCWFMDACKNGRSGPQGQSWIMGYSLKPKHHLQTLVPVAILRHLQVDLSYDPEIGRRSDSEYHADKSRIWFKCREMGVLVEHSSPQYLEKDRLDILVIPLEDRSNDPLYDPASERRAQLSVAHWILQKAELLKSINCNCPGLQLQTRIIKPWKSADGLCSMSDRDVTMSVEYVIRLIKEKGVEHKFNWTSIDGSSLVKCVDVLAVEDMRDLERSSQASLDRLKVCVGELDLCDLNTMSAVGTAAETAENEENAEGAEIPGTSGAVANDQTEILLRKLDQLDDHIGELKGMQRMLLREFTALKGNVHNILRQQESLKRQILSLEAFLVQEKERSVPRLAYLKKKVGENGVNKVWIKISEAFQHKCTLHFMCEASHANGLLHEVQNQLGVEVTEVQKWVQKLSPILNWTLKLAFMSAKIAGTVLLPGLDILLVDVSPNVLTNASQMAYGIGDLSNLLYDGPGASNPSSSANPIAADNARLCRAEALDFLRDVLKPDNYSRRWFQIHVGLRKVKFTKNDPRDDNLVLWICPSCFEAYGNAVVELA